MKLRPELTQNEAALLLQFLNSDISLPTKYCEIAVGAKKALLKVMPKEPAPPKQNKSSKKLSKKKAKQRKG